jgi:hypothetical protein
MASVELQMLASVEGSQPIRHFAHNLVEPAIEDSQYRAVKDHIVGHGDGI